MNIPNPKPNDPHCSIKTTTKPSGNKQVTFTYLNGILTFEEVSDNKTKECTRDHELDVYHDHVIEHPLDSVVTAFDHSAAYEQIEEIREVNKGMWQLDERIQHKLTRDND